MMLNVTLPEGAVAHCQVCVTGYLTDTGMQYAVATYGEAPCSTYLGLLELAKHDLIQDREL